MAKPTPLFTEDIKNFLFKKIYIIGLFFQIIIIFYFPSGVNAQNLNSKEQYFPRNLYLNSNSNLFSTAIHFI